MAEVEPWGLAGDRRFMLVDDGGEVVTAREFPPLVLVTPLLGDGVVQFQADDQDDLTIPVPDGADQVPVEIWQSKLDAALADSAAHAWFSDRSGCPFAWSTSTTRRGAVPIPPTVPPATGCRWPTPIPCCSRPRTRSPR